MELQIKIPEINLKEEDVRILLAIKLFEEGLVSLGKAGEISRYSERSFSEILLHRGISPIRYENTNLKEELNDA